MKAEIIPGRLHGVIPAIPSKSHAHRVLIAQKLARIQGQEKADALEIPTFSEDIEATKECLTGLEEEVPRLNCHESGSTLRFLIPVAMALKSEAVFEGAGKLPGRPVSPLKEEMERHGCVFLTGKAPRTGKTSEICRIQGRLTSGEYRLAGNVSSQFITGLLYALPILEGDSVLELTTELESAGYVELSLKVLRDFGIRIRETKNEKGFVRYEIPGGQKYLEPDGLTIEGDWSNAAFWLACGALGGEITCTGLDMNSAQRDKEIVRLLREMGADIEVRGTEVRSRKGVLKGISAGVRQVPDLVPVLAAVMAMADGDSEVTEAQRLKIKESDRLLTVEDFLGRLGADVRANDAGLKISGKAALPGGTVNSHNDHRIAMAAAVASCGCSAPVMIEDAGAVKKSYPGFYEDFAALGGKVRILE